MKRILITLLMLLALSGATYGQTKKVTQLTADTAPTSDDLTMTVNDPAGTPANRKVTLSNLTKGLAAVVGDSGSGGTKGLVPAPASGDAAANKFLKADGTWTAPGGGGTTINSTDNRIPYRSNSTTFADSPLIRHALTHMAFQDSAFTGTSRIFDWYYESNNNSDAPTTYNRLRLQNISGGDWYLRHQGTTGDAHFHIGTATGGRLYLRSGDVDIAFVNGSGLHSNGNGTRDLGEGGTNNWGNIFATTTLNVANVRFSGSSTTATVGPAFGGSETDVIFQVAKAKRFATTSQAPGIAAGSATWNLVNGGLIKQSLTANITIAPTVSNPYTDQEVIIALIQDATGSRTMTWPAAFKFAGGTAPTLTTTASSRDIFKFWYDGTNYYETSRSMDVR